MKSCRLFLILVALMTLLAPSVLWAAYDFADTNIYGHVFYYRIINDDHAVALTYPGSDINHPYQRDAYTHYPLPSGEVVVSSRVSYQGQLYSVEEIDPCTFQDCQHITAVTIPEGIRSIGFAAFSGCHRLQSVSLPSTIVSLGSYLFRNCTNLQRVVIPDGVATLGNNTFDGCGSLYSVSLGMGITNIQDEAFFGCGAIDTLWIANPQPPQAPTTLFTNDVRSQCVLMVPCRSLSDYQSVLPWSLFHVIYEADTCWARVEVQTNDSVMGIVLGSGTFNRYSSVSLFAVPSQGHYLQSWSTGSQDNPLVMTPVSDTIITASFAPYVADTLTRVDTIYTTMFDTIFAHSTDTVFLTVADSIFIHDFDTVYVGVSDTIFVCRDTVFQWVGDTVYLPLSDTVYLSIIDTVFHYDTILLGTSDTLILVDTLLVPIYLGGEPADSVWMILHDTIVYVDTIYNLRVDTVIVPVWVHDTVMETTVVHDTMFRFFWVHDTVTLFDTVLAYNTVYDTLYVVHFDTLWRTETLVVDHYYYDTVFLTDTVNRYVFDTIIQPVVVCDTIVNERVIYLTDTLQIVRFDTLYVLDTFFVDRWYHDTVVVVGYNNPPFTITVATLDPTMGVAVGSGHFYGESSVEIGAIPMRGYLFSHWDDGEVDNPRKICLTSDSLFVAHFVRDPGSGDAPEKYRIGVDGNQIVVFGALGKTITIYDAAGRRVHSAEANSHQYRIGVADTGMYIVQIGMAVGQRVVVVAG